MKAVDRIDAVIDSKLPQSEEAIKKRRNRILIPLAGVALVAAALGAVEGLKAVDNATERTVASVTETMPNGGDYISLAKQAVIDLGLNPNDYNATRIGQEITGEPNPQPGQPVKFNEVQHWYGEIDVEGSAVNPNK